MYLNDQIEIRGSNGGADALENYFLRNEIKVRRIYAPKGIFLQYKNRVVDVGFLRYMEFFPELKLILDKAKKTKISEGLVLGMSFGRDAIFENMIHRKIINLAVSAQDFYYDWCALKVAKQSQKHFKFIIQTVAPFSFRYDESMSKTKDDNIRFYYSFYGTAHNNQRIAGEIEHYEEEKRKFNELFYGITDWNEVSQNMWDEYFLSTTNVLNYNYEKKFDEDKISQEEINIIKRQYKKPFEETILENKRILYGMFEKTQNTRVLFFLPPLTNCYKKIWNEEYYIETKKLINEISSRIGASVLDMTSEVYKDDYFRDSMHLNREGAILVAEIINEWIG
ncbi:MAG: hypothetical protein E7294_09110 [Lachnospiraceae bacterium]|jgi:hypothetical protein|nr:hypothetical protein [Lachnospiraceae bacterium]